MLESILLEDFQNHKSTLVEFDPALTVIVGPNDAGKSAVLRALRLACLNQPNGFKFVRRGRKKTKITVKVDYRQVKRIRGRVENAYYLDKKEFKAFGLGSVPPEIQSFLQMSDVNFQNQIDPPFWFLETAGQVSKNLNKIVNLDQIDKVLSVAASATRSAKSRYELSKERTQKYRKEMLSKKWVVEFAADLRALEALEETATQTALASSNLLGALKTATNLRSKITRAEEIVVDAKILQSAMAERDKHADKIASLKKLVARAEATIVLVDSPVPDISELDKVRKAGDAASEKCSRLDYLIRTYENQKVMLCAKDNQLQEAEALLAKKTKGKCPVCGSLLRDGGSSPSSAPTYTCRTGHPVRGRND